MIKDNCIYILKYIGYIKIPIQEIVQISTLPTTFIPLSYGSKGFMGFNGSSMSNEFVYINDLSKMVKISTKDKSYIISIDNRQEFIKTVKN